MSTLEVPLFFEGKKKLWLNAQDIFKEFFRGQRKPWVFNTASSIATNIKVKCINNLISWTLNLSIARLKHFQNKNKIVIFTFGGINAKTVFVSAKIVDFYAQQFFYYHFPFPLRVRYLLRISFILNEMIGKREIHMNTSVLSLNAQDMFHFFFLVKRNLKDMFHLGLKQYA